MNFLLKNSLILVVFVNFSFGQGSIFSTNYSRTPLDTLSMKEGSWGYDFYQGGLKLEKQQVSELLQINGNAYSAYKSGKTNTTVSMILGGISGAFIGYPLGTWVAGGKANWTMAGVGVGVFCVALPIGIKGQKKYSDAIAIYNSSLKQTSFIERSELKLSLRPNGLGLVLKF